MASTTALAEVTDVDRALVEKGRNVFRNGGAENGRADWSASGGSILANSTAAGSGKLGISWDSSAAAQTLILTSSVNVPESLKGRNGAALCKVKVPSGVGTHTFTVDDGTNNLATAQTITSGTTFSSQVVNFIYPTTATPLRFKFTSVASNEPEIYVDECVATDAFNISQVAQATFYAQMKQVGAANCSVSATPSIGTYSDLATMASCASAWTNTGASVTNSATSLSQTLNGLSPGVYLIKYQGYIASALGQTCYFRFSDGTTTFGRGVIGGGASANNTSGIEGVYTVTSPASPTIKIQATDSGNAACTVGSTATYDDQTWTIYKFPSVSEIAYRAEQNASYYSGYHDATCSWSISQTTYAADFTGDASCNLVQRQASGISCVATGSTKPGLACTLQKLGTYFICGNAAADIGSIAAGIELWDGTTVIAESNVNVNDSVNRPLCGLYNATSLTPTFMIRGKSASGTINMRPSAASSEIEWSIFPITGNMPAPVLVGSVTSGSTGAERIERARITCSNSAAAIVSQSGTWLSSVSNGATAGLCTANFTAGTFSATPVCLCTNLRGGSSDQTCVVNSAGTISSSAMNFERRGGGAENGDLFIQCMGPR